MKAKTTSRTIDSLFVGLYPNVSATRGGGGVTAEGWGEQVRIGRVGEAIEEVISREQVRAALMVVSENAPPADTGEVDD